MLKQNNFIFSFLFYLLGSIQGSLFLRFIKPTPARLRLILVVVVMVNLEMYTEFQRNIFKFMKILGLDSAMHVSVYDHNWTNSTKLLYLRSGCHISDSVEDIDFAAP